GVIDDQHARHEEAVDTREHDDAEQVSHPHDGDGHDHQQRQQNRIDEAVYDGLPSSSEMGSPLSSSRPRRSSVSSGLMPAATAACTSAWVITGPVKKKSSRTKSSLSVTCVKPAWSMSPAKRKPAPSVSIKLAACARAK